MQDYKLDHKLDLLADRLSPEQILETTESLISYLVENYKDFSDRYHKTDVLAKIKKIRSHLNAIEEYYEK